MFRLFIKYVIYRRVFSMIVHNVIMFHRILCWVRINGSLSTIIVSQFLHMHHCTYKMDESEFSCLFPNKFLQYYPT